MYKVILKVGNRMQSVVAVGEYCTFYRKEKWTKGRKLFCFERYEDGYFFMRQMSYGDVQTYQLWLVETGPWERVWKIPDGEFMEDLEFERLWMYCDYDAPTGSVITDRIKLIRQVA